MARHTVPVPLPVTTIHGRNIRATTEHQAVIPLSRKIFIQLRDAKYSYRIHANDYHRCQNFLLVLDNHVADDKSCYTPRSFMHLIMKAKYWIFVNNSSYISKHCLAKSTMFSLHVYYPNQNGTSCLLHLRLHRMLYTYWCNNIKSKVQSVIRKNFRRKSLILIEDIYIYIYRVSQEEWTKLRESVP